MTGAADLIPAAPMTSEAKRALSTTVRALRERLLADLHDATDSAYRLSVRTRDAGLGEAARRRRERLQAWIDEQVRTQSTANGKKSKQAERSKADFRRDAEQQAAYTLLNRLVLVRLIEAADPRRPAVVTGGWQSRGYQDFRQLAAALARRSPGSGQALLGGSGHGTDETEGYAFLLRLVFEDLATELPGLFGSAGIADLIPIPASTLRHLVEALDDPALASCWTDDMTLGWVYQYWNDPAREALDAKLNDGGKVEPHEIASKTQMFTERYMVDWLLQNSLGPMWLAMCQKHGWTPEVEGQGVLAALEERRTEWREKRERGEVELTALMPLHSDAEQRWAYYVPQPIPPEAVQSAPDSIRDLKLLDPAVGSGHFLVVAFDLLFALYQEEARHRSESGDDQWTDRAIVERILEHNLHGIDLDPRAVQIAAAALWLKAKRTCPEAEPARLQLVASDLRLAGLPDDDPALVELRHTVQQETGIPPVLTDTIVEALRGADHLGSLLKVDAAVDAAIEQHERSIAGGTQLLLEDGSDLLLEDGSGLLLEGSRSSIRQELERFLSRHGGQNDLGLRLRGEQLARGIRFLRLVHEGQYDLVVGNPPYQGTSKMVDASYVKKHYPRGKADLFAAFLERGLQLACEGGVSALLTMRNWMFIKQYAKLREHLLEAYDLRGLGDFAVGAFDEVPNDVLSVVVSVFRAARRVDTPSIAQQPTPPDDTSYDRERTRRKRAATLCHVGRHEFTAEALQVVPEWPLVYWWDHEPLARYRETPLVGQVSPARQGLATADNARFLRRPWEVCCGRSQTHECWVPYIKGAAGRVWMEPYDHAVLWARAGLQIQCFERNGKQASRPQNQELYFKKGVAFSMIGASFTARAHWYQSIFGHMGSSVFPDDPALAVCALNSTASRQVLSSLNPGVHFEVGDVNRLPMLTIPDAAEIFRTIVEAFSVHESRREPSIEFKQPGPSPWTHAQEWAQLAVDREENSSLPVYAERLEDEATTDHLGFAIGVALGRFGADAAGIVNPDDLSAGDALPTGVLFLDGAQMGGFSAGLSEAFHKGLDSLGHPCAAILRRTWETRGEAIDPDSDLRTYLRTRFFDEVHRPMYENRPIHWPLSSAKKTFVAWVNIHRWNADTLRVLLADHLRPAQQRLEGQLADLRSARDGVDPKAAKMAEKQLAKVQKWREELDEFVQNVEQCAEHGPPPASAKGTEREVDARYDPDLDDGVMINSAALWPLLEPQWKAPKKWWKELTAAKGRKDYDWSHLAMRYFPRRVDGKCQTDPSLGVAHSCFWRYHSAKAWAWELRLQDEIGPDFRIEEAPYDPPGLPTGPTGDPGHSAHRAAYLKDHPAEALAAVEKEALRRRGRGKDATTIAELHLLEPGLWSALPSECWALELRIIEKQEADFHLRAPDESKARAAYEVAHPAEVQARKALLAKLTPTDLFESTGHG